MRIKRKGRKRCRKVLYPSEGTARNAAEKIKASRPNHGYLRPYECDRCPGWHLSSETLTTRRKRAMA